ncbi:hypothetical protein [Clostridium sp.]|uniref:hypothetical protein n=1 Tax=Clostridium sp. TaxID=1506 RepID=UPI003F30063D
MKNCYDKAMEFIRLADEISELCSKLEKIDDVSEREIYEKKIDRVETEFFRIKNRLKEIEYVDINI